LGGSGAVNQENSNETKEKQILKLEEAKDGDITKKPVEISKFLNKFNLLDNNLKNSHLVLENKVEVKKEVLPDNQSTFSLNRVDSSLSKTSETPSNILRLSFNNEEKKDKTLLKKFINMKKEPKN
jgi:hypothetical protein